MNEQLDPRIQEELESLNEASRVINELENKLNETRNEYRNALSESTRDLNRLAKKIGDAVAKARPYYDAKQAAKEAQLETQHAAVRYERAVSMHTAAREMVAVAEQGMAKGGTSDTAWQEMLNHATLKVNDAEAERLASGKEHHERMESFKKAETRVSTLDRRLKFSILKSRKYFELKELTNSRIQTLVNAVKSAEKKLLAAKSNYSQALKNLEEISDEIHAARRHSRDVLGEREAGVGAEEPAITQEDTEIRKPISDIYPEQDEATDIDMKPSSYLQAPSQSSGSLIADKKRKTYMKTSSPTMPAKSSEILLSVADLSQVNTL